MNDFLIYWNMKIAWDDSAVKLGRSDSCGREIRASSQLFSQRAADLISEAYLIAMTGDRHDEVATLDLSITPS